MPTIQLPDGQNAEFPDNMSLDQIKSVVQKKFPPSNAQPFVQKQNEKPYVDLGTGIFGQQGKIQNKNDVPGMVNRNLNDLSKGIMQSGGIIGSAFLPEVPAIMEGSTLLPKAINVLSKIGLGGAFGAMSTPDQPYIGGALGAIVPSGLSVLKNLSGIVKNALNKIPSEKIGKSIQLGHDVLKKSAEDIFTEVGKQVKQRTVPAFPVDKTLISDISEHLPKDRATKQLLKESESGQYGALRDLQSDLFHEGTLASKSDLSTERRSGKEMLDLRNRINESISDHLKNTGNDDLSKLLDEGRKKYKDVMDIYYSKKLPISIKNMVHPDSREIPNNIAHLMSKKSVPIGRIHNNNPFVTDLVKKSMAHENALKKLKILGGSTLGIGSLAGLAGLPSLYHKAVE